MIKIFLLQQVITDYRLPIFNKLGQLPGYDLTVIAAKNPYPMDNVKIIDNPEDCRFKVSWLSQKKILGRFYYFPDLPRYLKQERPDVIIAQNMYYPGFLLTLTPFWLIRRFKIKTIYWTIPQKPAYTSFEFLKPLALRLINAFLVYGEHGIPILNNYKIGNEKIFVAYNSPDTDSILRIKAGLISDKRVPMRKLDRLIFMGRLIPEKKVDLLIQAFVQVVKAVPTAELLTVGDGQKKNNLVQLTAKFELDKKIIFLGKISDDQEKALLLLSSGVFILPGIGGLAINEAMCYDLPIICSVADGTEKQLVINGRNGLIFRPNDVNDLADKIIQIISSPDLQAKMSKQSAQIISEKININTMLSGITQAIDFVMQ